MDYNVESWTNPGVTIPVGYYEYEDLLKIYLGQDQVLFTFTTPDEAVSVITDGTRIGLVYSMRGCCEECDDISAAETSEDFVNAVEAVLEEVPTFFSWEEVHSFVINPGGGHIFWTLRFCLKPLEEFSSIGMPVDAHDIFTRLMKDSPGSSPTEVGQIAKALH